MSKRTKRPRRARPAAIFAALGDETRLRIVGCLSAGGPQSITRLTLGGPISRQAVTKHLRVLEGAGLACSVRAGRERVWELEGAPLAVARLCLDGLSTEWDAALARLKNFVEG
jgi:DNA-binding transcriptional ArsR family regulator